ncbi:unnamed protein product [Ambrosiozyma monospora]|uniref:Unnamed protein product n=1 Tax=Ambrosiozyma monospora TaxID=43982 RepID=A0A9W7DKN0_AMBMO|nr:unnamed protein product [Ambrosiozyma monospora]
MEFLDITDRMTLDSDFIHADLDSEFESDVEDVTESQHEETSYASVSYSTGSDVEESDNDTSDVSYSAGPDTPDVHHSTGPENHMDVGFHHSSTQFARSTDAFTKKKFHELCSEFATNFSTG